MNYVLSIDWLSIHCHYIPAADGKTEWQPAEYDPAAGIFGGGCFRYKLEDFGTRQFSRLYRVSVPNDEGGWDDFAEVQASPHSGILHRASVIVRFVNRQLYTPRFWENMGDFLDENEFRFMGITRIDICADFNNFECIAPLKLIEDFASKKLRHIGRGIGALYFMHGNMLDKLTGVKDYAVKYSGLSFGTHTSDARVYLYNKSLELMTVKDKPYIRDTWVSAGLDVRNVWRLEISIKSKGCKFKDNTTGKKIEIDAANTRDQVELTKIYHTFVRRLFSFVPNRKGITNITHEFQKSGLKLFTPTPIYDRGVIRNISCSNRAERMILKALYQLSDTYRGGEIRDAGLLAQEFAFKIAEATDLTEWMSEKITTWDKPTHK